MLDSDPAHVIIDRPRVSRALGSTPTRLRLLCAPVGSGVTTALLEYERSKDGIRYVALPIGCGPTDIRSILRSAGNAREILVDNADRVGTTGLDAMLQFASGENAPRLLLAGHERSTLRVHMLVARGEAELINAGTLAFDDTEIARLASCYDIPTNVEEVMQLHRDTEGWAIAVAWIVREAGRARHSLCGAFETWVDAYGYLLREFIDAAIRDGAEAECVDDIVAEDSYAHLQR